MLKHKVILYSVLIPALVGFMPTAFGSPISIYSKDPSKFFVIGSGLQSSASQRATVNSLSNATGPLLSDISGPMQDNTSMVAEQGTADRKLIGELFKGLGESFHIYFRDLGVAQQKAQARAVFGEQARTTSVCNSAETAVGLSTGKKVEAQVRANINKDTKDWNTWSASSSVGGVPSAFAAINHLSDLVTWDDLKNEKINPESETLTDDEVKKQMLINKMLINPTPPLPLNDDLKSTPAGEKYEVAKSIFEANLLLPDSVKNKLLTSKAGAYVMGGWAKDVWEQMGVEGDPPGLVDGKLSFDALLSLLVDSRLRSVGWNLKADGQSQGEESGGNDTWVEREALMAQAIMMAMENEELGYLKMTTQLMADTRSSDLHQMTGTLDLLHNGAINDQ